MSTMNKVQSRQLFIGKLDYGSDLLEEISLVCKREDIRLGRVEALGAVQKACIGYYDQKAREYRFIEFNQHLEITHLIGNISLKDGAPMVHGHITLSDEKGNVYGGHLSPGTIVFACEFILEAFDGPLLNRGLDRQTGLPLWSMSG